MSQDPTTVSTAPDFIPARPAIDEATELLNIMQKMLVRMGTDTRRESEEFRAVMGQYKTLGTELHGVRKKVAARDAAAAAATRRALFAAARPGMSALERARQAHGGASPLPSIQPGARVVPDRAPAPASAPASDSPAAAAAPQLPDEGPAPCPPAEAPPASSAAGLARLSMPRFAATLGPAGRPGVITHGPEIVNLQRLLAHLGYDVPAGGAFDLKTARAVQTYQQANDLPANALVGAQMRRLLNQLVTG